MATAAQIKKATSSPVKSAGMRELLSLGMTVSEVADAFEAPYGFVYGVATRANGGNPPAGAERRTAKAAAPAKATRPAAKTAAKATAKAPARAAKRPATKAGSKVKAKA